VAYYLNAARDLADQLVLWSLAPLGIYILLSGLDDLFVDLVWLYSWLRRIVKHQPRVHIPSEDELVSTPIKRIAIFVPLWHEHKVIGPMLAHNIASIRYPSYDFFVGAYPNDKATVAAVREAEARFPNVHLAICPHDGPTSKADCLNWIYQRMLMSEELNGTRFDAIVTHDAEDMIHPESLRWINYYVSEFGFVQIPVLALPTPLVNLTHGVYCDEFAEFQSRDLPVRNMMGGFVPSAGVGTAYSRDALEALATSSSNRIFEPICLTEDYENGYRLHELGFRQIFVPIVHRGTFIATREYFPRRMGSAIRQRTRWITGIALQGWERHRWRGGPLQVYWLWRDRKGLICNPISLATNLVFAYSVFARIWERASPAPYLIQILSVTFALHILRTTVRIGCTSRIYGIRFGIFAPVRAVVANLINSAAVIKALHRYALARSRGEALVWVKTEHAYPSRAALLPDRRPLREILVGSGYIEQEDLDQALATKPAGLRLGEHLVAQGKLSEDDLYEALSLQQHLPLITLEPEKIARTVARAIPAAIAIRWKVLPFRIEGGRLNVASPEMPVDAMEAALRSHTGLEVRVHLVTPMQYRELERRLELTAD
jgi:adsorption protein B